MMKKIGEGYYYNVYRTGDSFVFKKIKSRSRMFIFIFFSRKGKPDFLREYKNVIKNISSIEHTYSLLKDIPSILPLLGNPVFQNKSIEYSQDFAIPLKKVLKTNPNQGKEIIEKFISLIKKMWALGVADRVFNFTLNNGLNKQGDVILFDFNEVTFLKDDVKQDIESRIWLNRWSFSHLDLGLQTYFTQRMSEELTVQELNRLWATEVLTK